MTGRHHPIPAHQRATLAGALPASPPIEAIEQENVVPVAVPVVVEGTVMVHRLPAKRAATMSISAPIAPGYAGAVLGREPKRHRAVLVSTDKPFYYATSATQISTASSAATAATIWPANVPLVLENTDPVYIASADVSANATVGVLVESWAD